jgi:hypothetical protein
VRTVRTLFFAVILAALLAGRPALVRAFPPLPSSFYGAIQLNGANLPDGARVEAVINDQVFAYTLTQTHEGASVYSLDIPGDDSSTANVEGGKEGDVISFKVAGILAGQTAAWHSGTNARLDLTAASANTPLPPQPTPAPPPTQTPLPALPTSVATSVAPPPTAAPVDPIPAADTSTPVAGVTAESQLEKTAVSTVPPVAPVESPTPPAAAGNATAPTVAPTGTTVGPTLTVQPTPTPADEAALQPSSDARPPAAGADVSQPVLAGGDKPATTESPTDTDRKTGPVWLLWSGASLIIIAGLVSGAWWLLRRRGGI